MLASLANKAILILSCIESSQFPYDDVVNDERLPLIKNFDLFDAQQEDDLAVEHLAPSLATIRMELFLGYMSDGNFWKIYFAIVHPRHSKTNIAISSTLQQFAVYVQIMEARAMLTLDLDKRSKEKKESDLSTRGNIPSKREGTRSLCFKYSSEDDIGVTCDLSLRSGICN
ncbi:hypothetical protein JHK85_028423 [Glycine max]|nr:hypothetical protein JHK85_028423 [Glycine max]